jgi:hypothetical protein
LSDVTLCEITYLVTYHVRELKLEVSVVTYNDANTVDTKIYWYAIGVIPVVKC